jgi:hypothetical protein
MINKTRFVSVVFAAAFPVLLLAAVQGCGNKNNDEPPAAVSVAPIPTPVPTPTAPATVMPEEDAGPDAAADAAADAKPVGTGGSAAGTIAKCCAALAQNANSAPPEQKGSYLAAAAACNGLRSTPVAQQAFGQIRAFLAGAKMPGACQ